MRRLCAVLVFGAGCVELEPPTASPVASFDVKVLGIVKDNVGIVTPLDVVATCADSYGGNQTAVPAEARGTFECPYVIPRGEIQVSLSATALDAKGDPALAFADPVSFRVVPGDLTGDYPYRWAQADAGTAVGTIKTTHQYGEVRIWAEHAPPKLMYADGGYAGTVEALPKAPARWTYATGLSPVVYFEEPSLQKLQIPDGLDNRSSAFVGEFLSVGRRPESGRKQLQACANDPARNGVVSKMVVTGTDPSGFFVTDITACRLLEEAGVRPTEPTEPCTAGRCEISQKMCSTTSDCARYAAGTYAHMFVYNYSFPDGLDTGDLLWTLSGSVQEFTSTTQLTFPAWTIAERVHELPESQWTKWLDQVPVPEITLRMCGGDNTLLPFLTDSLCGHNKRNLKMEANESGLVRLRNVRFPQVFVNCDMNGDSSVPFFCEQTDMGGTWIWGSCAFGEVEPDLDRIERTCNHDCVVGLNQYSDTICSEESTFSGFGQFVVEMTPPGLDGTQLDSSLPARSQTVTVGATAKTHTTAYDPGAQLAVGCTAATHYRFGNGTGADATDPVIQPGETVRHVLTTGETKVSLVLDAAATSGQCSVSQNPRVRMNLITKDAIPELQPNCHENDADAEKALRCRQLHAATFDVVGHLRHVQPARPRWVVLPRDADDVCCHPGAGLQCPKPLKQCP